MRCSFDPILTNGSMSVSITSNGVNVSQHWGFSIQAIYSGIGAGGNGLGTLSLQVSNDNVQTPKLSGPASGDPAANVQNWTNYTNNSTSYVVGSSSYLFHVPEAAFNWARLVYTAVSGSGVLSANFFGKGI